MTFKKWIKQSGMTQEEIAKHVGISQSYVARIAKGGTSQLHIALKIRDLTKGKVSVDDLEQKEVAA